MIIQSKLLAVVLLAAAAALPGAGQTAGWEKAQSVPAGTKVELILTGDKNVSGTLSEVSPEGLTLERNRDSMQVAKLDVLRMSVVSKGSRLKNVGIAALIGFAVGCPIGAAKAGYLSDMNNPSLGTRAGFCAAIGGFAGGIAAGVTAPFPATRRTLVYRSSPGKGETPR